MNNKKYIISVIALLGFADVVHSAIYQCRSCSAGTYGDGTSTSCYLCPTGSYSDGVSNASCTKCPVGTYSANTGAKSCTKCPEGKYVSSIGSTSCNKCPSGAVCPEGCSVPVYNSQILSRCGELGVSIAKKTDFSNGGSAFILNMIEGQKVKVKSDGSIIKKGDSGYDSAKDYVEVKCYDLDGYYTSDGYNNVVNSISVAYNTWTEKRTFEGKDSNISANDKLEAGFYKVELSGAGGGGGGSHGEYTGGKKYYHSGGKGCGGEYKSKVFFILKAVDYSVFASTGKGNHGGERSDGKDGGNSSFSIPQLAINISAYGGGKGYRAYKDDGGKDCVCTNSNCSGASGGAGGKRDDYPKSHPGGDGGNGYVKILQLGQKK